MFTDFMNSREYTREHTTSSREVHIIFVNILMHSREGSLKISQTEYSSKFYTYENSHFILLLQLKYVVDSSYNPSYFVHDLHKEV